MGFHIYRLRSFECKQYKVYFHLWGGGGASWDTESNKFDKEEEFPWTLVSKKNSKSRKSYAAAVRGDRDIINLTGDNSIPLRKQVRQQKSIFDRLSWPRRSVFDRLQREDQTVTMMNTGRISGNSKIERNPGQFFNKGVTFQLESTQYSDGSSIIIVVIA